MKYSVGISCNINVMNRFVTETLCSRQVLAEAARVCQKLHKCAHWVYKSFKPRQTGRNIRSLATAAVPLLLCFFCSFISFSFVFSQKNKIFFFIHICISHIFVIIHIQLYRYVHNYLQSLGIQYDKREQKDFLINMH